MSLPQLRVRTEHSYRKAYGPINVVAAALSELGCPVAGIVDAGGTWGHVQWEKYTTGKGIEPLYGCEFSVTDADERKRGYWVLARSLPEFYAYASDPPEYESEIAARKSGLVIFAGSALTDPTAFDYIDINPRSRMSADRALKLHRETGKPLVITSDVDYPTPADEDKFMAWVDSRKMTPQHILTEQELRAALWYIDDETFNQAIANTKALAAELVGCRLAKAPIIDVPCDLDEMVAIGKDYRLARGHIKEWSEVYQARLEREVAMIKAKKFESYFAVVADMILWAKQRMLVGPGRGSSAGSLVCYLLQITEVDPLVHNLIFERFIDVNRSDLPDIDVDFNDKKRELVFEYLQKKYGKANTARIGSINRLKPRSVIAHVGKKMGIPHGATFNVTNVLIEHSSGDARYGSSLLDTLETTQPGQEFLRKYPEAIIMTELENHASHTGVHAAGFIVSNHPVTNYCSVVDGIAQIDKKDAESLNLLKIDVLGLRTLGVIEETGCITNQELYDLELNDPDVLDIFNQAKFSGIFQFEGAAQRRVSVQIPVKEFQQIDHITALARPGPLGGGASQTYIQCALGMKPLEYRHPLMEKFLSDTLGVVLYQEQVMKISFEIGKLSWEVVSELRKAMSGSKGVEYFNRRGAEFIEGAISQGIPRRDAEIIWGELVTFGGWGMNKSHTVSYAIISYWCAYMKQYHPLQYAASCLRNAKDDEQTVEILRELNAEGISYISFDPVLSEIDWSVQDGKLVGGFKNLHGIGPAKAQYYVQLRDSTGLKEKDLVALAKHEVKHKDLRPAHTLWGDIYTHPENYNIEGPVKEFAELDDMENAVVICQLLRSDRRDDNEERRINKRGYVKKGQTLFLDAHVVDDSISKPIVLRLKADIWFSHGQKMADRAVPKQDWFLVRGKWLKEFSMMTAIKIKCLTNKEMFL